MKTVVVLFGKNVWSGIEIVGIADTEMRKELIIEMVEAKYGLNLEKGLDDYGEVVYVHKGKKDIKCVIKEVDNFTTNILKNIVKDGTKFD